jgi:hypothetical protein
MHHFDEMAKALAGGLTRRQALRKVGGGLAGALLASVGLGKASGATPMNCADYCKNFVGIQPGNGNAYGQCVSNCANCIAGGGIACGADGCCTGDEVCTSEMICALPCVPDGGSCSETSDCCDELRCCRGANGYGGGGVCVDVSSDPSNCGDCGLECPRGAICSGGRCVFPCGTTADCLAGQLCVAGFCQ